MIRGGVAAKRTDFVEPCLWAGVHPLSAAYAVEDQTAGGLRSLNMPFQ